MHPSSLSISQVLSGLGSNPHGLTPVEAGERARAHGLNILTQKGGTPLWRELLEPFSSLFVLVLLAAIALSLLTGHLLDAAVIGIVVSINALIEWYQIFTAKHVLTALRKYDARLVSVRRGGRIEALPIENIVPGDILLIEEGDRVPADGRLIHAVSLRVDESSLTGESSPAAKDAQVLPPGTEIFGQKNMVFRGTAVVSGRGELVVTSTGSDTEFGRIAQLSVEVPEKAPLQKKIDRLAGQVVLGAFAVALLIFTLGILRGYPLGEMLRFTLAMTVAAVPEGLPAALAIIYLLGIKRMAGHKALVRQLSAVETLGMITLIATDKTGTLTENRLSVAQTWAGGKTPVEPAARRSVSGSGAIVDPVDQALSRLEGEASGWEQVAELPFQQELRISAVLWRHGKTDEVFVKGAPEMILERSKLSRDKVKAAEEQMAVLASQGFRVIGIARAAWKGGSEIDPAKLTGLEFVGLVALNDGLRHDAAAAVHDAQGAGVRVVMVTGDHATTAVSIARSAGIAHPPVQALTGRELMDLPLDELGERIERLEVAARVLPEHKYALVEALRRQHVVAMTGDGVNDAPALARANIGIAMGSGTDIAKEAADIVLLDNAFATIVRAIREGRTIYANVRKMVFYLFATSLGEMATMVGALLAGLPLPVTAAQILWINLVTDGAVVIPLGLEPHEPGHMKEAPRRESEPLLDRRMVTRILILAATMAALALTIFTSYLSQGLAKAQTMAFLALVVAQWANALNARSESESVFSTWRRPNVRLLIGLAVAISLQLGLVFGPFAHLFTLAPLVAFDILVLVFPFIITVLAAEIHKSYHPRRIKRQER